MTAEPAANTPLSVELLLRPDATQSIKLSPSGRWMAIRVGEPGTRIKLTVIDLEGKEPSKVIAMFSRFDISSFQWVNDDWRGFSVNDQNDFSGKVSGEGWHRCGAMAKKCIG